MCSVMCRSLKGHIFVVSVQQVKKLELERTAVPFVNSFNRRRQSNTLHNINVERSDRNETTYTFLICEDFL